MTETSPQRDFDFQPGAETVRDTVLGAAHQRRVKASRLAPFAGYRMPLWFSSIRAEHTAVREAAGLFDCTHMGVFSLRGPQAAAWLDAVSTNAVSVLPPGRAQYGYLLDPAGAVLDDIIVYHLSPDDYLLVVNAANAAKIKAWFAGLGAGRWVIDTQDRQRTLGLAVTFTDHADLPAAEGLVDIAVQGPQAGAVVTAVSGRDPSDLPSFGVRRTTADGLSCLVARTGYTGARVGFELFVPRAGAEALWEALLAAGADRGLLPCGLGARDSLRIEAGLPLYGHELAGPDGLSPYEAGYDWAVKLDKPFFIGQAAMRTRRRTLSQRVARLGLAGGRGVRPVRPGDSVLAADQAIGSVLSSASAGDTQIALARVPLAAATPGQILGIRHAARAGRTGETPPAVQATVLPRFARF